MVNRVVAAYDNYHKQYQTKITKLTTGALNNSKGRWHEFIVTGLFAEVALDFYLKHQVSLIIFRIPNSRDETKPEYLKLCQNQEFQINYPLENIEAIKEKIFLSSPDYVISVIENDPLVHLIQPYIELQANQPEYLGVEVYDLLKGKLKAKEVKGVISVKVSNRPGRRYQALYETAMIKAVSYTSGQIWKYYMITAEDFSNSDKRIFSQGIAPHGIALNLDLKSVDNMYSDYKQQDLINLVEYAIFR
ncbi:MAG: deoxyribose-phosphate aldolase [Okeania sp. SIO3I5]|uniref:Cfr10I/Bse634I family restriction endonuclease n=1 Tax=Okeania sp. SIO3I5 TaxID=2607805 RepID=UPI0013BC33DF|nr:Cfr10I/Bse634I family restriction endonuclease [Okeania sp. SIO3I5]NEQ40842.1 deoxyribose-phosphate aldolase [Okeania sp. SIO3I5]